MINRVSRHKGCLGVMVFSYEGVAIKSTFDESQTLLYANFIVSLVKEASNLGSAVAGGNALDLLRIRTKTAEFMISPDLDHVFVSIHQQVDENASAKPAAKET